MPFSAAMLGLGGGRVFNLAPLTVEDLATLYVVETQCALQFPALAPTQSGDTINLTLSGVDFVAALTTEHCIDGDGLHDEAQFRLTLSAAAFVYGLGGNGGKGGHGDWDSEFGIPFVSPGIAGTDGGSAIRLGCPTTILGTGTISKGYGGGGGGGGLGSGPSTHNGGSGGGGGLPLGLAGQAGTGTNPGAAGNAATILIAGAGGTVGPDGGTGGDSVQPAAAGETSTAAGGAAGSDGNAIDTQGFGYTADPGITIIGAVI